MLIHRRKSRMWKIYNYLADRKSREVIKTLILSHKKEIAALTKGFMKTIDDLRQISENHQELIKDAHSMAIDNLISENNKKNQALGEEAYRVRSEMHKTMDLYSRAIDNLSEIESIQEKTFHSIASDLRRGLPQLEVALTTTIQMLANLERTIDETEKTVALKKKEAKDLVEKNHNKGKKSVWRQ